MNTLIETVSGQEYEGENFILRREYGETPNGNPIAGRWVLRDAKTLAWIDHDQYRNDLASRYKLELA